MSEITNKINKLAKQHEVIGTKTDCPYFSNVGNLCSRVQNGMMRCDEYLECEFKYIDALKEENEKLKQENMGMKKSFVDIIDNVREENYRYYKALKEADALFEVLENIMPTITLPDGNDSPRAIKEARNKINEVLKDEQS